MKYLKIVSLWLISISLLIAQDNSKKEVAVTVYNTNLGVIKEKREMDIKKGLSEIKIDDVASLIDPTSVHFKLNGDVLEQNYQYDLVDLNKILQKYINKKISLIDKNGNMIEGELLSSLGNQVVLANKNSGLTMLPNVEEYRFAVESLPEGLITKPTLVWQIDSKSEGNQNVEISYQTGGMKWSAEYVAVLNENDTKLDLNSWVSIVNNSGATYNNAVLKLVAGDVNKIENYGDGIRLYSGVSNESMMKKNVNQFQEKEFFEYHIYKLDRKTDLMNNETKQVALFEANEVKVQKKFLYKGGYDKKVDVIVEFANTEDNELGKPMPEGKFRVYKSDGESIEFIGEDMIDHTAKKENVKLKIGEAFDVVVEETLTDNDKVANKVYEQTLEIKIKNRKNENIDIDVERALGSFWEIIYSNFDYTKKNSSTALFKIPVKADSEVTLEYKVRFTY